MYGLLFFKVCLGSTAYRAFPIIRHIFPLGADGYAIIRISLFGVINIPTDATYVPVHSYPPFVNWLVVDTAAKSKSAIVFVQFDAQFLLYRSWARFKSIFLLLYFNQTSSARWLKHFFTGAAHRTFPVVRQVFKLDALGDFPPAVPPVRIINKSAINGLALIHFFRQCHLSSQFKKVSAKTKNYSSITKTRKDPSGWKAMRPECLEAKNNSPLQASQFPGLPAFKLIFLF